MIALKFAAVAASSLLLIPNSASAKAITLKQYFQQVVEHSPVIRGAFISLQSGNKHGESLLFERQRKALNDALFDAGSLYIESWSAEAKRSSLERQLKCYTSIESMSKARLEASLGATDAGHRAISGGTLGAKAELLGQKLKIARLKHQQRRWTGSTFTTLQPQVRKPIGFANKSPTVRLLEAELEAVELDRKTIAKEHTPRLGAFGLGGDIELPFGVRLQFNRVEDAAQLWAMNGKAIAALKVKIDSTTRSIQESVDLELASSSSASKLSQALDDLAEADKRGKDDAISQFKANKGDISAVAAACRKVSQSEISVISLNEAFAMGRLGLLRDLGELP